MAGDAEAQQVLCLDLVQAQHAGEGPAPGPRGSCRVRARAGSLQVPAFLENRYFDVLASNPLAVALSPRLTPGENRLRSLLLDPEEREFHQDWEGAVAEFVAAFRHSLGSSAADPRAIELVGELSLTSARFRTLWARHDVRQLAGGTAAIAHPSLGPLTLHRDKLPVGDLVLVLYYPEEHSESADRLALLASLASAEAD